MSDAPGKAQAVWSLIERGVTIPSPWSVEVEDSVIPDRIAPGVIIHAGCRIAGAKTSIGPGSELGKEAPVTIENCQLGHGVELKGGFFSGATFLDGANMGSAAHVRSGTLLEEEASGAHAVGFKQTVFLSYVTAGSLINFCDALVAGGTSRKNHSEIGSSYIHFNFSAHQDKATPTLVGDVPRGVFLDQPPIFLGGQGGLAGPVRIAYGTVLPAGTICRQDILEEGTLFAAPESPRESRRFAFGIYRGIDRIVRNNLIYIGNLWALQAWYRFVRIHTMSTDSFTRACYVGALERIEDGLRERIRRLHELADKMAYSLKHARTETGQDLPSSARLQQQALADRWPEIEEPLSIGPHDSIGTGQRDLLLQEWEETDTAAGHCSAVKGLSASARKAGAEWLQSIVGAAAGLWGGI